MNKTLLLKFGVLFVILLSFSAMSLGYMDNRQLVKTVEAIRSENPGSTNFVTIDEPVFSAKIFQFLKTKNVCTLSAEQARTVADFFTVENRPFTVDGETIIVALIRGDPINRNILESKIGPLLPSSCRVIQKNQVLAVITPFFVS